MQAWQHYHVPPHRWVCRRTGHPVPTSPSLVLVLYYSSYNATTTEIRKPSNFVSINVLRFVLAAYLGHLKRRHGDLEQ